LVDRGRFFVILTRVRFALVLARSIQSLLRHELFCQALKHALQVANVSGKAAVL